MSQIPALMLELLGQENRAIAKMTRDAPYMDSLKYFGSPWLRPRLLFPKLLMGFCCDRSYESAYEILKFVDVLVPEIIGGV